MGEVRDLIAGGKNVVTLLEGSYAAALMSFYRSDLREGPRNFDFAS
jgi:hypothetical protein